MLLILLLLLRRFHLRLLLQGQAPGDVRVDQGARHGAEADGADDEGRALFCVFVEVREFIFVVERKILRRT